jgi:catechol 2,3-dioxygenase-like lactoylglutathione lyase family enzyme
VTASTTDQSPARAATQELRGVVQVTIPVTDLACSAAWYRDLLDLTYVREFTSHHRVTGCALADWEARYFIALRLRSTTAGDADLRGEHPVILEATDAAAAKRIRDRAHARGIDSTSGTHMDGTWIEFVDPDGIAVRIVHSATGPTTFMGVDFTAEGGAAFYGTPRLRLSATPERRQHANGTPPDPLEG